mmetsp:Transcript_66685/g.214837  ORF Transcript_66685/g.214837 Transcript_66685/m.214837 type:complete len:249 (-) Transcript_66685:510-1256(-)
MALSTLSHCLALRRLCRCACSFGCSCFRIASVWRCGSLPARRAWNSARSSWSMIPSRIPSRASPPSAAARSWCCASCKASSIFQASHFRLRASCSVSQCGSLLSVPGHGNLPARERATPTSGSLPLASAASKEASMWPPQARRAAWPAALRRLALGARLRCSTAWASFWWCSGLPACRADSSIRSSWARGRAFGCVPSSAGAAWFASPMLLRDADGASGVEWFTRPPDTAPALLLRGASIGQPEPWVA